MKDELGIALIGCGTVGTGVAKLLTEQAERLTERAGRRLTLRQVVVRNPDKPRDVRLHSGILTNDLERVCADPAVQVAVELIGGTETARDVILKLLESGKDVVTANKAVLAHHGDEIFEASRKHGRSIGFEASVAGGIPIVSALAQGLAANQITTLKAILNGTTNFILTQMTEQGWSYSQALAEAQRLGFAEADPTLDVNGTDAAHKLAILARIAFGISVPVDGVQRRGIDGLQQADLRFAGELGFVVKLLAEAWLADNAVALHVEPTLLRRLDPLAEVRGPYNAIHVVGDAVGDTLFYGRGAGQMPTASAVVADIIDLAVGRAEHTFRTLRLWSLDKRVHLRSSRDIRSRFYLRINAEDQPGVFAEAAGLLAQHGISIASVIQHEALEEHNGVAVPVVIMTHSATIGKFLAAVERIDAMPNVVAPSVYFPVAE